MVAQSTACNVPLSAADVITCFNLTSMSPRLIPSMLFCDTNERCTYSRTAGGHSIFFAGGFEGEGEEGDADAAVVAGRGVDDLAEDLGRVDDDVDENELFVFVKARRVCTGTKAAPVGGGRKDAG